MAESDEQDRILLTRISKHDRLALNTLFGNHYQRLCNFAFTFLNNREDAEECVADVFVNIWKYRQALNVEKSVRAYLFVSVRHAALAYLKKRNQTMESIDHCDIPDSESPQTQMELAEFEEKVLKTIHSLSPRCQRVFYMSRIEGYTYQEIGEMLGISLNTVENQIVKALKILRPKFTNRIFPPTSVSLTEA